MSAQPLGNRSSGARWVTTATGIWVPIQPVASPATRTGYGEAVRQFWKICLTSKEILDEQPDLKVAEILLSANRLRFTLGVLSRAAMTLSDAPYTEIAAAQPMLARGFLPEEA